MKSLKLHKAEDYASFSLGVFPHSIGPWTSRVLSITRHLDDDEAVIFAGSSALAVLTEHVGHKVDFDVEDIDVFCLEDKKQYKRVAIDLVSKGVCGGLTALRDDGWILQGKIYETPVQFIGYEKEQGGTWVSLLNHFDVRICKVAIVRDGEGGDKWTIRAAPGVLYDLHRKATEICLPSPHNFSAFWEKHGTPTERVNALYERGAARRERYIKKGFQVYYFDEGSSWDAPGYPVEIWLSEVVFNRLFSVPYHYLLGGSEFTQENNLKAVAIVDHINKVLGSDYTIECETFTTAVAPSKKRRLVDDGLE